MQQKGPKLLQDQHPWATWGAFPQIMQCLAVLEPFRLEPFLGCSKGVFFFGLVSAHCVCCAASTHPHACPKQKVATAESWEEDQVVWREKAQPGLFLRTYPDAYACAHGESV